MRFATTQAQDELVAGVDLEGVGRIAAQHAGAQHGARHDAGAAGHGGVVDGHAGVAGLEDLDQGFEGGSFVARPPGEDLDLVGVCEGQVACKEDREESTHAFTSERRRTCRQAYGVGGAKLVTRLLSAALRRTILTSPA
jgi:hypothetical protein